MRKEQNILKRYFLWVAPGRLIMGFLLGWVLGMLVGVVFLALGLFEPDSLSYTTILPLTTGTGLLVCGINFAVCKLFVSYSTDPVLFFLADRYGEIVLDTDGKVTAGGRLWVLWGMGEVGVRLADTIHPHEIAPWLSLQTKLTVFFKGGFDDAQEVYEKIIGADCRSFDHLVREAFIEAVNASPSDVQDALYQRRSLKEQRAALLKMKGESRFRGRDILSNIDYINVSLTQTAAVNF